MASVVPFLQRGSASSNAGTLTVLGSTAPLLLALLAWKIAASLAGPNVSDLGVPMYARGPLAIAGGLGSYLVSAVLTITVVARLALRTTVAVWVSAMVTMLVFFVFTALLFFQYG